MLNHHQEELVAVLEKTFENAPDPIITMDNNHNIMMFNRAAVSKFGYSINDVLGRHLEILFPDEECVKGGHGPVDDNMGDRLTLTGRKRSGEKFLCDVTISRANHKGKTYCTAILRDAVAKTKQEEELVKYRKTRKAELLSEVLQVQRTL